MAEGGKRRWVADSVSGGKFWEISRDASTVTTTWGKLGTAGQSKAKAFPSVAAAEKFVATTISKKEKEGYVCEEKKGSKREREEEEEEAVEFDTALPLLLRAAHALPDEYDFDKDIDFEPFDEFLSFEDTDGWVKGWTGNEALSGNTYRVFGQSGTGGYAVLWMIRRKGGLEDQPVAFFDSEGEVGIVARNLREYLWVLAGGYGPNEAHSLDAEEEGREKNAKFTELAAKLAPKAKCSAFQAVSKARQEFPRFAQDIEDSMRH